jgi:ferrous iron transport protein A
MHSMNPETDAAAPSAPPTSPVTASAAAITLDALARQVPARVVELHAARDTAEQELLLRLMEIGFLPGEPVRILAAGFPGDDPLAVRVGQATFALRRHEAALVRVVPEAKA